MTRPTIALRTLAGLLLLGAAAALGGCETTGEAIPAAAKPVEEPMTHTRAARECWMGTEKTNAAMNLDKRADIVQKCIDQKMKTAPTGEPKP